tara:strand:- start:694 stop:870 length:177 start_codon:yes stop_codon:yes gene_type:complete
MVELEFRNTLSGCMIQGRGQDNSMEEVKGRLGKENIRKENIRKDHVDNMVKSHNLIKK